MSSFIIYPAIDLRHGKVVRLKEGDPLKLTSYSSDPASVAKKWIDAGAKWLHVINLDGAFDEETSENEKALNDIITLAQKSNTRIQCGGGIRTGDSIRKLLAMGVARIILGTMAFENKKLLQNALLEYGEDSIAVSLDARDGIVQVHGWQSSTQKQATQMAAEMVDLGINWIIYTDICRDGLQTGLNIESTKSLLSICGLNVIASGGVNCWNDIIQTYEHHLSGVIVGRALYENQFNSEKLFNFPENYIEMKEKSHAG